MLSLKIPLSKKEDFPLFLSIYDEIFVNISDAPFNQNRLYELRNALRMLVINRGGTWMG